VRLGVTAARTVLAFDFGLKRIGIASGDTLTRSAAPHGTAAAGRSGPDWSAIARAVRTIAPAILVVGAPYNADGSEGALTAAARAFAAELARRFALPVHLVDERFSSLEASAQLRERRAGGARRRRLGKSDVDSAAAAVILGRWLSGEGHELAGADRSPAGRGRDKGVR
jgi:putative holliday junction resolvase